MRTERNLKVLAVLAIVLAVGGLSVGFAAFSRSLSISNVSAGVSQSHWDISFTSIDPAVIVGADTTASTPSLSATSITNIDINLKAPGDSVSYTFTVENGGDYDAIINGSNVVMPTPTCSVAGDDTHVDAVNVCSRISYTLTYADGTAISSAPTLDAGTSKDMKLSLVYDANTTSDELPDNTVDISGLDFSVVYVQN